MFSRGMSQVSAMISATLSKVVDIRHARFDRRNGAGPSPAFSETDGVGPRRSRTPRIAKDAGKFNGGRPTGRSHCGVVRRAGKLLRRLTDCEPHGAVRA